MKHNRLNRNRKAQQKLKSLQKMQVAPVVALDRTELDKTVIDLVLKKLYDNADKNFLHLDNEIFAPSNVVLPPNESERIWEVMLSSGWVSPVVGFGNAGKVELTKSGYQLMSQFGGYSQYLDAMKNNHQPQTIILPIQVQEDDSSEEQPAALLPGGEEGNNKAAEKTNHKRRVGKK